MNKIKHSNVHKKFLTITFLTNEPIFIKPVSLKRILVLTITRTIQLYLIHSSLYLNTKNITRDTDLSNRWRFLKVKVLKYRIIFTSGSENEQLIRATFLPRIIIIIINNRNMVKWIIINQTYIANGHKYCEFLVFLKFISIIFKFKI